MEQLSEHIGYLNTPLGIIKIEANKEAIIALNFTSLNDFELKQLHPTDNILIKEAKQELVAYFDRKLFSFHVPLAPKGTEFQKRVWKELTEISYGVTNTYKDISLKLDSPQSVRAVGTANGANPIPIIIPCHRVIGADGSMVGYSGGLWRKQFLLGLEGARSLKLF